MKQEKSPETGTNRDFVKNIFEREKRAPAAKKISSLFGGASPAATKAEGPENKKSIEEFSPVGIEVEAESVSAVQLGKSNGQWEVVRSASKNIPAARGSVRQFLSENGMKGEAIIGLSANEVQFCVFGLPPMPAAEIDGAVAWGAAEALGIEARRIEDFSLDYDILSENELPSRGKKVFVAAVRKDIVTGKMKEASEAGLNVIAVEPSALALYAAFYAQFKPEASKLTLMLNIGLDASSLVIAAGADVYAVRHIAFTEKILRGALNDDGSIVSRQSASFFENLIVDIEHSYKSVSNQFSNPGAVALGVIAVCGPGAKHRGIAGFLKNTFNIFVDIFDPLGAGVESAAAISLAMRGRKEYEAL